MKTPDFMLPVNPEGLDDIARELLEPVKEEEKKDGAPAGIDANINKSDYILIPTTNSVIAKQQSYSNLKWADAIFKLNENKLFMPTIPLMMKHLENVIQAKEGKVKLYDAGGKEISKDETAKIYDSRTKSANGIWTWLDADFKVVDGKLNINYNHKFVNNELKPANSEQLLPCVMKDCYVDLTFNKQGLPIKESGTQSYLQGKNINYWNPRSDNNSVARFWASSDWANLYCNWNPDNSNASLGVFACAEGASAPKNGGSR